MVQDRQQPASGRRVVVDGVSVRLAQSIDILVDANKLPTTPKVEQIFSPAFLPPLADLPKKLF